MLQLTRRVGFGVDVRDLLEFERAFQRNRVMQPTPEEQRANPRSTAAKLRWAVRAEA